MSEEGGPGIGSIVPIILIVLVLVALAYVLPKLFLDASDSFKDIVGEEGELKDKFNRALNEDKVVVEEEEKQVDDINAFFKENFEISENNCISRVDFTPIKFKRFYVEVDKERKKLISEETFRVYDLEADRKFIFMKEGVLKDSFSLLDKFSKIDGEEFSDVVFFDLGIANFLSKELSVDLSGEYSPVFEKKECGKENIEKDFAANLGSDFRLKSFLESTFLSFEEQYFISDLVFHLLKMKSLPSSNVLKERISYWEEVFSFKGDEHFVQDFDNPRGCLRMEIFSNNEQEDFLVYGFRENGDIKNMISEGVVNFNDGNFVRIKLFDSKKVECEQGNL